MSKDIIFIFLIAAVICFFVYREYKYRCRLKEALIVLDDIISGNDNRRIYVGDRELIAPLIFKVNQLVDTYQKDKASLYRTEQARRQMLSNMSHDVRTPLTSVLGYLDALCSGMAGSEEKEYLHIARDKAYALKEYIDELFTIARIDADEIQIASEPIDMFELLRSTLIGWVPVLQKENIALKVEIPDEECYVMGDQHAMTRVFNNLIQNAVRYGGNSHILGVAAGYDESHSYFEVWDNGPGVSKEEIPKIFERLYKCDSSRSTRGHGLGLTIARELVQKMNGTIGMESIPHVKTSVRVFFPKIKKK